LGGEDFIIQKNSVGECKWAKKEYQRRKEKALFRRKDRWKKEATL